MKSFWTLWVKCFRIACVIVGPVFLLVSLGLYVHERSFLAHVVRENGIVTQLDERVDQDNTVNYFPVFVFSANGQKYTIHSGAGSNPPGFQIGQQVEVLFTKENPESATIDSFGQIWGLSLGFGTGGVVASLVGSLMILFAGRKAAVA